MKMKIYMVLGLPTEHDEDLENLAHELIELSKILPIDVGLSPLVPKRNTPLYCAPFIGVKESDRRQPLRRLLKGRVNIRPVETALELGGVGVGAAGWRLARRCLRRIGEAVTTRAYKAAF